MRCEVLRQLLAGHRLADGLHAFARGSGVLTDRPGGVGGGRQQMGLRPAGGSLDSVDGGRLARVGVGAEHLSQPEQQVGLLQVEVALGRPTPHDVGSGAAELREHLGRQEVPQPLARGLVRLEQDDVESGLGEQVEVPGRRGNGAGVATSVWRK